MGVTFVAILSHHFDNSNILSVPDLLNADENLRFAIKQFQTLPYTGSLNQNWKWTDLQTNWTGTNPGAIWWHLGHDGAEPLIVLDGPASIYINFGRGACCLDVHLRWRTFVEDLELQLSIRRITHAVAKVFNSISAIYIPDSSWLVSNAGDKTYEGFTFEQIQDWLLRTYGSPVNSLKNTQALRPLDNIVGGYYIDDFKDLD